MLALSGPCFIRVSKLFPLQFAFGEGGNLVFFPMHKMGAQRLVSAPVFLLVLNFGA